MEESTKSPTQRPSPVKVTTTTASVTTTKPHYESQVSSSASANNPKIVIQQRHVLLDPFCGGFPSVGTNNGSSGDEIKHSRISRGDSCRSSTSSASSSTSGSEFDEISTARINFASDKRPISVLAVSKFKGNSLAKWRGKEIIGGGVIIRGERPRPHSDSSATTSPSISIPTIITCDDDDDEFSAVDGVPRKCRSKSEAHNQLPTTSFEGGSTTDMANDKQLQEQRREMAESYADRGGGSGVRRSASSSSSCNSSTSSSGNGNGEDIAVSLSNAGTSEDDLPQTPDDINSPDWQSLKHLSVSAPAIRTASTKSGDGSDTGLPPMTTSKSRQKKFHRHFKTVPQDEKVLDYYSCALVADILLQGFLYITENYFAFYSNVFGYVTKVLIPVCSVVRITKERTAKIFPNAVGVCTRTEKHVFASLISRDSTFKLMCKVWNYSIEQEAEEIRALQRRVAAEVAAEDAYSADVPVPDESSGDSGSGNDSAIEPSSHSPSPQNTPGIEKLVHAKSVGAAIPSHLAGTATVVAAQDDKSMILAGGKLSDDPILNYRGAHIRTSISTASTNPNLHQNPNAHPLQRGGPFNVVRKIGNNVGGKGPSLLVLATALLVVLFIMAALLLSRISNLQEKLMERPVIHDSEQFYQELLSWQTKLHSTTGEEIHQYINSNLQQIVKVRESLEALSMLFVNRPQGAPGLGEPNPSSIMGGNPDHHHHHKES